jgi:glycosyltransferase involved in cell wall biosynthesis
MTAGAAGSLLAIQNIRLLSTLRLTAALCSFATQDNLVGVPVYRGKPQVVETLRCIQEQDCREFRVIISVDNNDHETAEICRDFLSDSRFSLKVQETDLGWAGNINWLMSQGPYDFFCYWQHDDFASHNYLSALLQSADENPSAVCYYSDIQWIGDDVARIVCPSVTGFPINRAPFFFESMNGIPIRGLIRKEGIERAGPIRLTSFESSQEEFLWLATLGREGNLHRVASPLYFKRSRKNSVSAKFSTRETSWKRSVWLEYGLGMLEIIWPLVASGDRNIAVGIVIDRLCYPTNARFMFYDPTPERVRFCRRFSEASAAPFRTPRYSESTRPPEAGEKVFRRDCRRFDRSSAFVLGVHSNR